jgi:hypothetical protein
VQKGICRNPIANIIINGKKTACFPGKMGRKRGRYLLTPSIQYHVKVLVSETRQEKEIKSI